VDRIEAYTDFRQYLKDFYEDRKQRSKTFSHRSFCLKAGLTSPSFLREVIDGKRNLTDTSIGQFVAGLGLSDLDAEFFGALVRFNQAVDPSAKKLHLDRMRSLRRRVHQAVVPLDRYEYYSNWYLPVLRELATQSDWNDDWAALARHVRPPIKAREAREGIALLERLGFLRREGRDWVQTDPVITTGSDVDSLAVRAGNRQYAQMGVQAIDELSPAERDISTLLIGLPRRVLPSVRREIQEFKERLLRLAQDHADSDTVFSVNIQVFPLSRERGE